MHGLCFSAPPGQPRISAIFGTKELTFIDIERQAPPTAFVTALGAANDTAIVYYGGAI